MSYSRSALNEEHRFIDRVRFPNGDTITLETLRERLQNECDANGIPVSFRCDTLKTGGLFSGEIEHILVLYHTDHPTDYLQFLIRITHQGKYAFMDVFKVGSSKNYYSYNSAADGSAVHKVFYNLSGKKQKLEEEENFYTILSDCMANIFA